MDADRRLERGAAWAAVAVGVFAVLVLVSAVQGRWAWTLVWGGAVLVAAAAGVAYARRPHHPPASAAPAAGRSGVVVVADAGCTPVQLRDALSENPSEDVLVVAPAIGSRLARWTGDEGAYVDAQAHLDQTLAALADLGVRARGHVGPHDPLQAADDGLRELPAASLIFVTTADNENWLEHGVVAEARIRYGIAVSHVVAD